jgi:hypothetical protein
VKRDLNLLSTPTRIRVPLRCVSARLRAPFGRSRTPLPRVVYNDFMDRRGQDWERFAERLIMALAAQIGSSAERGLAPEAMAALGDLTRFEASSFFGIAGHLVHYGDLPDVELLMELVVDSQLSDDASGGELRIGDRVRLVDPPSLFVAETSEEWLTATTFAVRFLGEDGTIDIQPDLVDDYVIFTVPAAAVSPIE